MDGSGLLSSDLESTRKSLKSEISSISVDFTVPQIVASDVNSGSAMSYKAGS